MSINQVIVWCYIVGFALMVAWAVALSHHPAHAIRWEATQVFA